MLEEEMRRVRVTLEWKAQWWMERSVGWAGLDTAVAEGVRAYAYDQAAVQRRLLSSFNGMWADPKRPAGRKGPVRERERQTIVMDAAVEELAADADLSDDED